MMQSYLITDPKYYSNDPITFNNTLSRILKNQSINMICFRDKESNNIESLVAQFINTVQSHNIEHIFINSYLDLAIKYNIGIHLTSSQFDQIQKAKENKLKVIISCHNEKDIMQAIALGADYITYSPIFPTPNKGVPKGIENLQDIVNRYPIKVIALGGIVTDEDRDMIAKTNCFGFASIRYFVK
jgi:thiamine-phosphate pyrophosphorylase